MKMEEILILLVEKSLNEERMDKSRMIDYDRLSSTIDGWQASKGFSPCRQLTDYSHRHYPSHHPIQPHSMHQGLLSLLLSPSRIVPASHERNRNLGMRGSRLRREGNVYVENLCDRGVQTGNEVIEF